MTHAEQQLLALLKTRCYKEAPEGEYFTLSSGEKSTFYFDAKNLFLSSEGSALIGEVLYDRTKDLPIAAIGGLEVGAIPLATAAVYAYHEHGRTMEGFFVRNEAKTHGTRKIVEGKLTPGSHIVIVDDVATKGGSIMKAVEATRRAECTPLQIIVLVDRQEGAADLFAKNQVPFKPIFTISQFRTKRP